MKLIGLEKTVTIKGELTEKWLLSWIAEIREARWRHASDILKQFPRAHMKEESCFEFYVKDTSWTICLQIAFAQGIAVIKEVKV